MVALSERFLVNTKGFTDIINITENVQSIVHSFMKKNGLIHIYVSASTASITTIEYEPGLLKDLSEAFEKIAPVKDVYHHDEKWYDGNGYAHICSSITGTGITIPLVNSVLELGPWQQIVLIDFDNRARSRNVIVQFLG